MKTQNISLTLLYSYVLSVLRPFITTCNKIGLNRGGTKRSHIEFWKAGPVSTKAFTEAEFLVSFEEASYTILSLVVLTDSLTTGLYGK